MTATSTVRAEQQAKKSLAFRSNALVRVLVLTTLFAAAALLESVRLSSLLNAGVWLHLRTGTWVLQTHSLPRTGLFSQFPSLPWKDSSWLIDVVLAAAYSRMELRAPVFLFMLFQTALAVITFLLAKQRLGNFWGAVALGVLAQSVIGLSQGLPYSGSILFFGVELLVLERSRRTGRVEPLYWLPALFLVWANVHALFLAGLALLIIFAGSTWIERQLRRPDLDWVDRELRPLPFKPLVIVSALSLIATLINPYRLLLFSSAYRTLYGSTGFSYFAEMRAMAFRQPQDYVVMLTVMAAFLALGRQRSPRVFEMLALTSGTLLGFRIQREVWMAVLPAIAILGRGFALRERDWETNHESHVSWEKPVCALMVGAILAIAALRLPDQNALMARLKPNFPLQACDFIRQNHLPPPLFHEYSWGDFLTWYLPEYPVAIDGRLELYGDEITEGYFKVIAGGERIEAYPALAGAQTLLLRKDSGMTKALTTLPVLTAQYRLAYSDDIAAVFVRQ